jgi:hypothetical protein
MRNDARNLPFCGRKKQNDGRNFTFDARQPASCARHLAFCERHFAFYTRKIASSPEAYIASPVTDIRRELKLEADAVHDGFQAGPRSVGHSKDRVGPGGVVIVAVLGYSFQITVSV